MKKKTTMKTSRAVRRLALVLALILALSAFVSAEKAPAPSPRDTLKSALLAALSARQTLVEAPAEGLEEFSDGTVRYIPCTLATAPPSPPTAAGRNMTC